MRASSDTSPDWAQNAFKNLCKSNKYTSTIWVVNSAVVKLSHLTKPGKVYRGISERGLPEEMLRCQEGDAHGGVELAFMSTTSDAAVAHKYASRPDKFGLVLEIKQGLIAHGADLSWLSQYPFEREILFAPLTVLEVLSWRVEGNVQIVEMCPTTNLKAPTVEQVIAKMQRAQVQLVDLLANEFGRVGVPSAALQPLDVLRSRHELRQVRFPLPSPAMEARLFL